MSRARDTANQINRVNSSAADATALTVDSAENIMIGTTVAGRAAEGADRLTIADASHSGMTIRSGENAYGSINFSDSEGGAGEYAGQIWYGHGSIGEKLVMAIQGSNKVTVDGDGLKFNNDTAAANALNDYEEGTWEPTIIGTSGSPTVTYQADNGGSYTKIGRVVYYTGCVRWTALSGGSGTARIGNLPFTSAARTNGDNADSIGSARTSIWNGTSSNHPTIIGMVAGNTTLTLIANDSTGTAATLQVGDLGTTCSFQFTCIAYV